MHTMRKHLCVRERKKKKSTNENDFRLERSKDILIFEFINSILNNKLIVWLL